MLAVIIFSARLSVAPLTAELIVEMHQIETNKRKYRANNKLDQVELSLCH
jgi:hypothetical protein